MTKKKSDPMPKPACPTPFRGWSWRGARLENTEIAAYIPGTRTLHLGVAHARIDQELDFPVLFRVYAHDAWTAPYDKNEVIFAPKTEFRVREVRCLPENRVVFCLEQVAQGFETDIDVAAEFKAWVPTVACSLPQAGSGLVGAWDTPFARWSPEAQDGDAPMVGVMYECEDAVRMAMEFTGLEEGIVRSVLEAQGRYLELAGTADCSQDEDLLRERDAMRHLLPENPANIDYYQEMAYLKLVTGLEEEVIDRVRDGELAYCKFLGIVDAPTGDDDEPEEDADEAGEGEEGVTIHEGHGDHWEAVVEDLSSFLKTHMDVRPGAESLRVCTPSPYPRWSTVISTAIPQSGSLETLRIDGEGRQGADLVTAFPVARDGAPHRLKIGQVHPWKVGCEAIVEASTTFGATLGYFDVGHLHPWNEVDEGDEVVVALAAFAYSLEPAPEQAFQVTQEETIRAMRSVELGVESAAITDLSPIEIRSNGMACLFPCKGGNPDEFEFQGPVESLDVLGAWDETIYRMDITVMRDEEPFTIPIYAAQHVLPEGYRPKVGDDVRGRIWMQGAVEGLRYPIISGD